MIDTNEALARIAVAEIEARRLKEKSEARFRRWRFVITALRIIVILGALVFLQVTHWDISGAQACGFFLVYLAASALAEHQKGESLRRLETELKQLKDELAAKTAKPAAGE